MYPSLKLIHKRCTLSCSQSTTQVDVPSTCTTKDVPSNVLRQSSQAVKPLKLCEWGYKRILRRLVLWNLLYMGMGRIKRILRMCRFEFFDKGEGRHKRIQAVSPVFFWKRAKRDTKRIQAVSPWRILFGKGRREWKRWIAQVFMVWKTRKLWKAFWHNEEEEVQRDSEINVEKLLV